MINTDKVAASIQFIGSSVKNLTVKNNFVSMGDDRKIKRTFDVSYVVDQITKEDDRWIGLITLSVWVSCKYKSADSKRLSFSLKLDTEGCFFAPADIDEDKFTELLTLNGCASLYSVARGIILSTTAHVFNGGSIRLPMINVFRLNEELQKEIDNK